MKTSAQIGSSTRSPAPTPVMSAAAPPTASKPAATRRAFSINASTGAVHAHRQPQFRNEAQLQLHRGGYRRRGQQAANKRSRWRSTTWTMWRRPSPPAHRDRDQRKQRSGSGGLHRHQHRHRQHRQHHLQPQGRRGDAAAFSINASTGAVTLTGNPNFEAKSSYNFTVVATDAAGNSSERAVSLAINNLDDVAPTITSGATATAINENSGAGQVVYTVTSTDTDMHRQRHLQPEAGARRGARSPSTPAPARSR